MEYIAAVHPEDRELVVTFPDCPGCVTQVETEDQLVRMAQEAPEGWLESHLRDARGARKADAQE